MVKDNLSEIKASLPQGVVLVAVSKFHPVERVMEAYDAGQRVFGENRPQEMALKQALMPGDIQWHQIGHLQTNKVRLIAPFVSMIESVDSLKLAQVISQEAQRVDRKIDVLLQIHVALEQQKFGWSTVELTQALSDGELQGLSGINIVGIMGMATFTDDQQQIGSEFMQLRQIFETIKHYFLPQISVISMGMSGDYEIAIECGSNMVRIGSSIFGSR